MSNNNHSTQDTRLPAAARGRGQHSRPGSRRGPHMNGTVAQPSRKIFNCICDDSALVAGVKRSTRNGIRQWVKHGQIRLFVPLNALAQLDKQKHATTKHGEDVRETLQWLDEVTTEYPNFVTLQGGFETFKKWSEVEQFTVPKPLFSENDIIGADEAISLSEETSKLDLSNGDLNGSVTSSASAMTDSLASAPSVRSQESLSPPTSPTPVASAPKAAGRPLEASKSTNGSGSVPSRFRPLFNYILWRIHQELDPVAALETFIFLCNDPYKATHAKGFDIRVKRLEQLREAVTREDRDFKARAGAAAKSTPHAFKSAAPAVQVPITDDDLEQSRIPDDSAEFTIPPKPQDSVDQPDIIDPDAFGREPSILRHQQQQQTPRMPASSARGGNQSPHSTHAIPGGSPALNGNGQRGNFRGAGSVRGKQKGHANGTGRGTRGDSQPQGPVIDPNSFTRPRSGGFTGRGGRKLWVPT